MRFRPGIRLVLALGALGAFSILGFFWTTFDWLVPVALMVLAVLAAMDVTYLRWSARRVTVHRIMPERVARGQSFGVALDIQNEDAVALSAHVRDEVPSTALPFLWIEAVDLPPRDKTQVARKFVIPIRGRWQFGPVWLRLTGRFGMVEAQQSFSHSESVQVYPESLLSPHELAKDAADEIRLLDQLRDTRLHGSGTEFESLEEFRAGDDPRHIDWRTTARHGRPVVRRYQVERHRDVMLLVDCGRLMGADAMRGTKLDCSVDAALRLLRIALRGGDRCGLGIFDDRVVGYLRPIGGANALPTFLSSLYDLQPRWRETDFGPMFARLQSRLTKRALVIVLSDVVDAETSERYCASLATLARRHMILFAALQTPLLGLVAASRINSLEDGYKKVVTFRVQHERDKALHVLNRSGVHVLDVEPSRLTAPLINQFIELRRSSLL